jgi:uncharacterized protein (UPF0332 family)
MVLNHFINLLKMLNEKRIIEANNNLKRYLEEDYIKKEPFKDIIFKTYLRNHKESLIIAKKLFDERLSSLWIIVISYYSMFYIANAVLYKKGYKVGSKIAHKVTADALIVLIRDKLKNNLIEEYDIAVSESLLLTDNLISSFDYERIKRSLFQYETTEEIKYSKAKTSLERAKKFSVEMEKLIL